MVRNGQKLLDVVGSDWMWLEVAISGHSDPHPFWPSWPLLMTISNHYWLFLTITKDFQQLPTTSSHFQTFLVIFGHLWPHPATSDDHFLPLLTFSDHYKAFTGFPATSNHIHPFMSILSHFWPFLTTCDPIWPLPPTSDDPFWPLMTISDHLKVPNRRGRHLEGDY